MLSADFVIVSAVVYVGLLFVLAYFGDRRARASKTSFLHSPAVYTLSISVYCTSWTFYGAVGNAARSGLEFLTIYLGARRRSPRSPTCCRRAMASPTGWRC